MTLFPTLEAFIHPESNAQRFEMVFPLVDDATHSLFVRCGEPLTGFLKEERDSGLVGHESLCEWLDMVPDVRTRAVVV